MRRLRTTIPATVAALVAALGIAGPQYALAQAGAPPLVRPRLRASVTADRIRPDGRLDEPAWARAHSIELVQVEPHEGGRPSARTVVRVLATPDAIVIGIRADDPDAAHIVSFSRQQSRNFAHGVGMVRGDPDSSQEPDVPDGAHRVGVQCPASRAAAAGDGSLGRCRAGRPADERQLSIVGK